MRMIPIVFIPGWPDESIAAYTQRLALQTPGNTAKWGKIYATTDTNKAHYAICQDNPISIHNAMQYGFKKSQIILFVSIFSHSPQHQVLCNHIHLQS